MYAYVKDTTCYLYIFGWAVANDEIAPKHGGTGHNQAIDTNIAQLKKEGATNIRKNQ